MKPSPISSTKLPFIPKPKQWYPHLAILGLSFLAATVMLWLIDFKPLVSQFSQYSFLSAFLAGFLFVYSLTVVWGSTVLLLIPPSQSLLLTWLFATLGAVAGNLVVLNLIKDDGLHHEIRHLFSALAHRKAIKHKRPIPVKITRYHQHLSSQAKIRRWHFLLSLLGALIIISPLPDEVGISLLGWSSMDKRIFAILSFFLNGIALGLILLVSQWQPKLF